MGSTSGIGVEMAETDCPLPRVSQKSAPTSGAPHVNVLFVATRAPMTKPEVLSSIVGVSGFFANPKPQMMTLALPPTMEGISSLIPLWASCGSAHSSGQEGDTSMALWRRCEI